MDEYDFGSYFDELTGGGYDYSDYFTGAEFPVEEGLAEPVGGDYTTGFLGLQGLDWTKLLTGLGLGGLGALGTAYGQSEATKTAPTTKTITRELPGFGGTAADQLAGIATQLRNLAGGSLLTSALTPEQQQLYGTLSGDILGAQYPRQTLIDLITQGTMPTESIGKWEESIKALEGITPQKTAEMMAGISPLYGRSGATEKIAMENIWKLQEAIAAQKQGLATQMMPLEEKQRGIKAGAAQQLMTQYPGMMGLLGLPKTAEEEQISQYFTRMQQPAAAQQSLLAAALGFAPTTATQTGQPGTSLSSLLLGSLGGAAGSAGGDILKNLISQLGITKT